MTLNVYSAVPKGASRQPVIYSHGGFRAIVDNPRCLTDQAAKAIAAKGGVIGIQFGSTFNNVPYHLLCPHCRIV